MEANEENLAHVAKLIEKAKAAGLRGADWLESLGTKRCCEGYNGIGPEFLPARVRDFISDKLAIFAPAALPHDLRNDVSDGTREKFLAANDEFRWNCLRLVDLAYPQQPGVEDDVKRARAKAVAEILYCFVSADGFGWKAWLEAHERATESAVRSPKQRKEKITMKKTMMLMLAACAAAMMTMTTGCVAIEVEDYGDEVVKDSSGNPVCASNGVVQTVHRGQRWHLNKNMVDQAYEAVEFERQLQNVIKLRVANYKDAVSPELNKLVDTSIKGAAELAAKIGAAIATSGGSVAGEAAYSALEKKIKSYIAKGGSVEKASVECKDGSCTISDGVVSEVCEDCVIPE